MIAKIKESYTKKQRFFSKENDNIFDDFDDLISKIELISYLNCDENKSLNYGLYLYIEDIKDCIKGLEFKIKKGIFYNSLSL